MTEPILDIRGVDAGYGRVSVLRNISLAIPKDEKIGLFGPNGHGKTTLLRTISGLIKPSRGEVRVAGKRVDGATPRAIVEHGVIHVPQGNTLFPTLSVRENLALGASCRLARPHTAKNLERVYALFPRLKERRRQSAASLSGGERQMLAIGAGLMGHPAILMLDEPTVGLAPKLKDELRSAIADIASSGVPLLLVEQDVEFLAALADRLLFVEHGGIAHEISVADGLDHDRILRLYLGEA